MQKMENVVFTQLSVSEIRQLFREELQACFAGINSLNSKTPEDELLTINETAKFLSLSVPTIYSLVSKSQLPVNKKGKRLYFSKTELMAWIRTGRKKTLAEEQAQANSFINRKAK